MTDDARARDRRIAKALGWTVREDSGYSAGMPWTLRSPDGEGFAGQTEEDAWDQTPYYSEDWAAAGALLEALAARGLHIILEGPAGCIWECRVYWRNEPPDPWIAEAPTAPAAIAAAAARALGCEEGSDG